MVVLGGYRVGSGIAHPATHRSHTPGTPLPCPPVLRLPLSMQSRGVNSAMGLISVEQLSLSAHFSEILRFTEVYNLVRINRINNHSLIPGFD